MSDNSDTDSTMSPSNRQEDRKREARKRDEVVEIKRGALQDMEHKLEQLQKENALLRKRNGKLRPDVEREQGAYDEDIRKLEGQVEYLENKLAEQLSQAIIGKKWIGYSSRKLIAKAKVEAAEAEKRNPPTKCGFIEVVETIPQRPLRCRFGGGPACVYQLLAWDSTQGEPELCEGCKNARLDLVSFLLSCEEDGEKQTEEKWAWWVMYLETLLEDCSTVCENERNFYGIFDLSIFAGRCKPVAEGERFCSRCNSVVKEKKKQVKEKQRKRKKQEDKEKYEKEKEKETEKEQEGKKQVDIAKKEAIEKQDVGTECDGRKDDEGRLSL